MTSWPAWSSWDLSVLYECVEVQSARGHLHRFDGLQFLYDSWSKICRVNWIFLRIKKAYDSKNFYESSFFSIGHHRSNKSLNNTFDHSFSKNKIVLYRYALRTQHLSVYYAIKYNRKFIRITKMARTITESRFHGGGRIGSKAQRSTTYKYW